VTPAPESTAESPSPHPAGYPSDLERVWQPVGGPDLCIRALRPDDLEREREFVSHLAPETLYLRVQYRVQYVAAEPTLHELERLLDLDYVERMAIGAFTSDTGVETLVGVSRYARIAGTTRAECAIVVADAWQGRGVGTELMRTLMLAAQRNGIRYLEGSVLAENQRIASWARRLGFTVHTEPHSGGLVEVSLDITTLLGSAG
jgi:acetyltransferase